MTSRILFFVLFMVFITFMLALDLGVFHKKDHVIKIKEAAIWTGIWVLMAMGMALLIRFHAEWIHGITSLADLTCTRMGARWPKRLPAWIMPVRWMCIGKRWRTNFWQVTS